MPTQSHKHCRLPVAWKWKCESKNNYSEARHSSVIFGNLGDEFLWQLCEISSLIDWRQSSGTKEIRSQSNICHDVQYFLTLFHWSYLLNDMKFVCFSSLQHTTFRFQNRPRWCVSPYRKGVNCEALQLEGRTTSRSRPGLFLDAFVLHMRTNCYSELSVQIMKRRWIRRPWFCYMIRIFWLSVNIYHVTLNFDPFGLNMRHVNMRQYWDRH